MTDLESEVSPRELEIGSRLRQLRESAGLSRAKLAKMTRLSEATIKHIESGHSPSRRTLATLARVPGFASLLNSDAELRVRMPDEDTARILRRIAPLLGLARDPHGVLVMASARQFVLLAVLALFMPELLAGVAPGSKSPMGQ